MPLYGERKREYYYEYRERNWEAYNQREAAYNKLRAEDRRDIVQIVLGISCVICGASPVEYHHIDPVSRKFNLTSSSSKAAFILELGKCQAVCLNCHKDKHHPQRKEHGRLTMYSQGCRCELCFKAMQEWNKAHKRRSNK